ncbi:WD40 repeat-like protein [Trametopsis cervina]|nr:WD40 repeat-like protein [Trametopsis cervina]
MASSQYRLSGIHIQFLIPSNRPRSNLQLETSIDSEKLVPRTFDKGEDIVVTKVEPTILCSSTESSITLIIKEIHRVRTWKDKPVVSIVNHSIRINDQGNISFQDPDGKVTVSLTFSTVQPAQYAEDALKSSQSDLGEKAILLDKIDKARGVIEVVMKAGDLLSDLHPAAKATFAALGYLKEACERQEACRRAASAVLDELEAFLAVKEGIPGLHERKKSREALTSMMLLIARISESISDYAHTGIVSDLLSGKHAEKITTFKVQFDLRQKQFFNNVQMETFQMALDAHQDATLRQLNPVMKAYYNSELGCLDGTRAPLLERISHWTQGLRTEDRSIDQPQADYGGNESMRTTEAILKGTDSPRVFWVHGLAGSGKSTISHTVAKMVKDQGLHMSCFFCKRDDGDRSAPDRLLPSLAYQFSHQHPAYREAVMQVLRGNNSGEVFSGAVSAQFQHLFTNILPSVTHPLQPHIVIIDALDECGTSAKSRQELCKYLLALARASPWIRVLLTSRTEPEIRAVFQDASEECVVVDINREATIRSDIYQYVLFNLRLLQIEISEDQVRTIVARAGGLFVWCSTVFKYLGESSDPETHLDLFINGPDFYDPIQQLRALYDRILDAVTTLPHDVRLMRTILAVVFIAATNHPLSTAAIAELLHHKDRFSGTTERAVRNIVGRLHAVIYQDAAMGDGVRVYHPSFLDYLKEKLDRAADHWMAITDAHIMLFGSCLKTLHARLQFNICDLPEALSLNKDIPDIKQRIARCVPPALQYSALFWMSHLLSSRLQQDDDDVQKLTTSLLCHVRVLHWLEVLSLLDDVSAGVDILQSCKQYFSKEPSSELARISTDLHRFVTAFSEAMVCTPHLYLSALSWLPEMSYLARTIFARFMNHHLIVAGKPLDWDATIWSKDVGSTVTKVMHARGRRCIIAQSDSSISIWDLTTGKQLANLHASGYPPVVCPPSGNNIAYVRNRIPIVLNLEDNAFTETILANESGQPTQALAISSDGRYIIACIGNSGPFPDFLSRQDHTCFLRLWDTDDKSEKDFRNLELPSGLFSIAISHLGQQVAFWPSSEKPVGICLLNTMTGEQQTAQPTTQGYLDLLYSPDGSYILISSLVNFEHPADLWDVNAKQLTTLPFEFVDTNGVATVAWSPDSTNVAIGGQRGVIYVLDVKAVQSTIMFGKFPGAQCLDFSPDGALLVAGFHDYAVRIWDVRTGNMISDIRGHTDWVYSVFFSSDGRQVVSGASDHTVRVWDLSASKPPKLAVAHEEFAAFRSNLVHFSDGRNGEIIRSTDREIYVEDARTEQVKHTLALPHAEAVSPITLLGCSPDGSDVAFSRTHHTIYIWRPTTNKVTELERFPGGLSPYKMIFSPDRQYALGMTIKGHGEEYKWRTWNTNTGEAVAEGFTRGSGLHVALSSDSSHIAFWESGGPVLESRVVMRAIQTGKSESAETDHSTIMKTDHPQWHSPIAFSPDGEHVAAGMPSAICIATVTALDDIVRELSPGPGFLHSLRYSPDGTRLAAGTSYGCVLVWDMTVESSEAFLTLDVWGRFRYVDEVLIAPDNRSLAARRAYGPIVVCPIGAETVDDVWFKYRSKMDSEDGWVKDDNGGLLLWVPVEQRQDIKLPDALEIQPDGKRVAKLRIDWQLLQSFHTNWRSIFGPQGDTG